MSTTVAVLSAKLMADTRDFDRGMDRSESKMSSVAKTAGKAGLAGALIGLGFAAKAGFSEFMEAEKVTAQTNAVLASTGGIAKVSAAEIERLSGSLMRKSGVDDEAIQSGQNMLLTFTKIRNETGAGNKVFDAATKATLDLSVAMGKDMQSSAILVGKALNDPIKGVGALSKAGVQLTQTQKDTIKTMVDSGNTMGAQKIILKELETQFGGSANAAGKTFGGQINIAKQTLSNMAGEVIGRMIPALTTFVTYISGTIIPWVQGFIEKLRGGGEGGGSSLQGAFQTVRMFIVDVWWPTIRTVFQIVKDAFTAIVTTLRAHEPEIKTILTGVQTVLRGVGAVLREVVLPALRFVFVEVLPVVIGSAITVIAGITKAIRAVIEFINEDAIPAFRKGFGAIRAPIDAVYDAVMGVVKAVKDLVGWIGKISFPSLPGWLNPTNIGDAFDPNMTMPGLPVGNLMGANAEMGPFAAQAAQFGLHVSSGLRPGAITANGTPSDHGIGKAIDLVGSQAGMMAYIRSLVGNRMVKQAFFDPFGSIFAGLRSGYVEGGHGDHVHVATYDQGGVLKPGWNLAFNGLGRNEALVAMPNSGAGTVTVNVYGDVTGSELVEKVRSALIRDGRRNSGGALGGYA